MTRPTAAPKWVQALKPRLRPGLIIVGAQKAGTSAVFQMMAQHPRVLIPVRKELTFFSKEEEFARGAAHYASFFPKRPWRGLGWTTLEASPDYLYHPLCAARIHEALPGVRIAIILRDPVRRAYSAWNMYRDFHRHPTRAHLTDTRSFEQAVADELAGRTVEHDGHYLAFSDYTPHVRRYLELFGRDRVKVMTYPHFKQRPAEFLNELCAHVGLAPRAGWGQALRIRRNARGYATALDPALEQELRAYFAPGLGALERLLGVKLDLEEA